MVNLLYRVEVHVQRLDIPQREPAPIPFKERSEHQSSGPKDRIEICEAALRTNSQCQIRA